MKKFFMVMVATMVMATVSANATEKYAENNALSAGNDFNINVTSLTLTLDLNDSQVKALGRASRELSASLNGEIVDSTTNQPLTLNEAINKNLKVAHQVLTPEQYHKYQTIINCSLVNKGLATTYFSEK